MEFGWRFVAAALMMILLAVLFFVGINPIKAAYNSFNSIGEPALEELAELKAECNEKQTDGCALEVAKLAIEAGEEPLVAESFVRKEIEFTNDEEILKQCFEFTKNELAQRLGGNCELVSIYISLFEKLRLKNKVLAKEIEEILKKCDVELRVTDEGAMPLTWPSPVT